MTTNTIEVNDPLHQNYNDAFYIDETMKRAPQPKHIKIPLKPHQLAILYQAKKLENNCGIKIESRDINIDSNFGVIGDKVGAGKSLVVLGLIGNNIKTKRQITTIRCVNRVRHNRPGIYIQNKANIKLTDSNIDLNVIAVSLGIFDQWKQYINDYTDLKCYSIKKFSDLRRLLVNYKLDLLGDFGQKIKRMKLVKRQRDANGRIITRGTKKQKRDTTYCQLQTWYHSQLYYDNYDCMGHHNKVHLSKLGTIHKPTIEQYDIILVTNKFYNELAFYLTWGKHKIKRVFFDEADSINIPNCLKVPSAFYWFITSSLRNIQNPNGYRVPCQRSYTNSYGAVHYYNSYTTEGGINNKGFILDLCINIAGWKNIKYLYLRNKDSFIDTSFKLPEAITRLITCRNEAVVNMLRNIVPSNVLSMISAGDIQGAITHLNIPSDNITNVIEGVTRQLTIEVTNLKAELDYKRQRIYSNERAKSESISSTESKLKNVEDKIKCLKERITATNCCAVCYDDEIENPTLLNCCQNTICFECVTELISRHMNCPHCRASLNMDTITAIVDNTSQVDNIVEDELEDKEEITDIDTIMKNSKDFTKVENYDKIIKHIYHREQTSNSSPKILIFSEYRTRNECVNTLNNLDIKYSEVKGGVTAVKSIINRYKHKDIDVLFLNAKYFGAGLNLENTTDIILTHKMNRELEIQVIGRAQRLGRKNQLHIWKLYDMSEIGQ